MRIPDHTGALHLCKITKFLIVNGDNTDSGLAVNRTLILTNTTANAYGVCGDYEYLRQIKQAR